VEANPFIVHLKPFYVEANLFIFYLEPIYMEGNLFIVHLELILVKEKWCFSDCVHWRHHFSLFYYYNCSV